MKLATGSAGTTDCQVRFDGVVIAPNDRSVHDQVGGKLTIDQGSWSDEGVAEIVGVECVRAGRHHRRSSAGRAAGGQRQLARRPFWYPQKHDKPQYPPSTEQHSPLLYHGVCDGFGT